MRTQAVNVRVVERLLEQHARMYIGGTGVGEGVSVKDRK